MAWGYGPFAIVTTVLLVGGVFKIRDPRAARDTLAALGVPRPGLVARLSGPIEIALGAVALLSGSRLAAGAVGAAFLVFTLMVGALLRGGVSASCGCFGRLSARPSAVHLATNAAMALVAIGAVAVDVPAPLPAVLSSTAPAETVLLLALVGLATALVVGALTVLPATLELVGRPGGSGVRRFGLTSATEPPT
jgi:hypothetical protein